MLLVVILDLSRAETRSSIPCILLLLHAHLALSPSNTIALLGASPKKTVTLYTLRKTQVNTSTLAINTQITTAINEFRQLNGVEDADFTRAYAHALCIVRRNASSGRIILVATECRGGKDVEWMNCVFAAQKYNVQTDTLAISLDTPRTENETRESKFRVVCRLTNGIYKSVVVDERLSAFVLFHYLNSDPTMFRRDEDSNCTLGEKGEGDGGAVCFCHGKSLNIANVCPTCLSVYC